MSYPPPTRVRLKNYSRAFFSPPYNLLVVSNPDFLIAIQLDLGISN